MTLAARIAEAIGPEAELHSADTATELAPWEYDGHPTDTSRDYDFTDWDAVERFGRECARLVPVAAP